jgi:hypothetical protein
MKANQEDEPFDPIDGPRRLESQRICLAGEYRRLPTNQLPTRGGNRISGNVY